MIIVLCISQTFQLTLITNVHNPDGTFKSDKYLKQDWDIFELLGLPKMVWEIITFQIPNTVPFVIKTLLTFFAYSGLLSIVYLIKGVSENITITK